MYYRLKDNIILRGWDKLPYALVNTETGNVKFVDSEAMTALEMCDGSIDFAMPFIPDNINKHITAVEQSGFIEPCRPGQGLNENQKYRRYKSRCIKEIQWSITGKCNYKCKHCLMSAPDANAVQLSFDEIKEIIRQMSECGVIDVDLTGGEPLARSDFLDIIDELIDKGIRIKQLYTNGALVNEKLLSEFQKRHVKPSIIMSYDGAGWHDWLRGIDGAEEKVNNAFRVCRDMGFKTSAAMCLHRCNAYTLRESVNHLASLGVKSLKTGAVSFVGEWKKNNLLDQSLSTQELFKIYLDYIPLYYQDGMPLILTLSSFFAAYPEAPDYFEIINYKKEYDPQETLICAHARSSCYISPEGRVLVCMSVSEMDVQNKFPTVFEKSLAECVSSPEFMKLIDMRVSDFFAVNQECRECKYSKHCYGGCHAIFLELDRENCINESPVMCELYSGGWIDKIINTVKKINPSAKCNVYDM